MASRSPHLCLVGRVGQILEKRDLLEVEQITQKVPNLLKHNDAIMREIERVCACVCTFLKLLSVSEGLFITISLASNLCQILCQSLRK